MSIIRTICPKIVVHPLLYLFIFLFLIAGRIKYLLLFMTLILMHELGHFLTAKCCGWETDRIELYPYGGISKFQVPVNVSIAVEFLVLVMGPVSQIVAYHVFSYILPVPLLEPFYRYHIFLLGFNLLPIYPLDGGRLLHLIFCKYLSFWKSFLLTKYLSYLFLFLLGIIVLFYHSPFFLGVLILLVFKLQNEGELFPYVFRKFLLERCLYRWHFRKRKVVFREKDMKRDTYHFFWKHGRLLGEEEYLKRNLLDEQNKFVN